MLPEEKARKKIDSFLDAVGWAIVPRGEFTPNHQTAVTEALMLGNTESDYLLFIDGKAIAVLEAKREENQLGDEVAEQAEQYAHTPQNWYGLWYDGLIPLVYMSNGTKILFKNLLANQAEYTEIDSMCSLWDFLVALQAEQDVFARLIAGVNAVPLTVGYDRIHRKSELLCNRSNWYS